LYEPEGYLQNKHYEMETMVYKADISKMKYKNNRLAILNKEYILDYIRQDYFSGENLFNRKFNRLG